MDTDRQLHREIMTAALERSKVTTQFTERPDASRLYDLYMPILSEYLEMEPVPDTVTYELLASLGFDVAASLALQTLVACACSAEGATRGALVLTLSRTFRREVETQVYAIRNPGRFQQLQRRFSVEAVSIEKAYYMMKRSAEHLGTVLDTFSPDTYTEAAQFAVYGLEHVGVIKILHTTAKGKHTHTVHLTDEASDSLLSSLDDLLAGAVRAQTMLCPPQPYGPYTPGGFLTEVMQDNAAGILGEGQHGLFGPWVSPPPYLQALNALQGTEWAVNRFILDVILKLRGAGVLEEVVPTDMAFHAEPFPEAIKGIPFSERTDEQHAIVREWSVRRRNEYGKRAKWLGRKIRLNAALREAVEVQNEPAIWQAWAFDTRGRMYPCVTGLSSQGSDMQKALLKFRHGEPMSDETLPFFKRNLAALYGHDKGTNAEMEAWVDQHLDHILIAASSPLSGGFWTAADSPLCFLAACKEYAEYLQDPQGFRSHLPIALDGKANALQHLSAIMLDPQGAERTGLRETDRPIDIYQLAADKAADLVLTDTEAPLPVKVQALSGFDRSLAKRTTMTLGYGVRAMTVQTHVADWLNSHPWKQTPEPEEGIACRNYLADKVWKAANGVVGRAMEAFRWLEKAGKGLAKEQGPTVSWVTPDGFMAHQYSSKASFVTVRASLHKPVSYRLYTDTKETAVTKHGTKFAPNFVHSLDATHLRMVILRLAELGCKNFAMIHDSFGCSVGYVVQMDRIIREEFVRLYQTNPLEALHGRHPTLPVPPDRGTFDFRSVLSAPYAFR